MVSDSLIFGTNIGAILFIQALFNLEFSKSCLFIFSLSNQVTSKIAKPFHFSFKQFSAINLNIVKATKPSNKNSFLCQNLSYQCSVILAIFFQFLPSSLKKLVPNMDSPNLTPGKNHRFFLSFFPCFSNSDLVFFAIFLLKEILPNID